MLIVETIARIRREHFIKGKTIKEIARDLKVSRNTVRKVLRSGETSFEYERVVQPRPKLGRWAAELDGLLAGNAAKSAREQLTLIRIFEELRERGYDGGYDAVRRYARRWSKERGESTAAAYVPLSFAPGEAYQFDWSHEVVLLNGITVIAAIERVRRKLTSADDGNRQMVDILNAVLTDGLPAVEAACAEAIAHGVMYEGWAQSDRTDSVNVARLHGWSDGLRGLVEVVGTDYVPLEAPLGAPIPLVKFLAVKMRE